MESNVPVIKIHLSEENNRLNKLALAMVSEARRLHGRIDVSSLSPEEMKKIVEGIDDKDKQ